MGRSSRYQASGGSQHARRGHYAAGKLEFSCLFVNSVGQRSSRDVSDHSRQERERRNDAERLDRQVPILEQVRRKPGEEKISPVKETAIAGRDVPPIGRT